MRFANCITNSKTAINIGDNIIALALDYIYGKMGVDVGAVTYVNADDLPKYAGEPIIMPIVRSFVELPILSRAFSKNVTPVFLSLVLFAPLHESNIEYLKRYEPIGCRDEYTLMECRRYGIRAYLNGCITVCFPRCPQRAANAGSVFLVDIQPELEKYIPEHIKKDAVRLSHIVPFEPLFDPMQSAKEFYERYMGEANLVITSRLHAALPCMAAGIPVVLAKNEYSSRFMWLEKMIPVYDLPQYPSIDWHPNPVEYEEQKNRVLRLAMARLRESYEIAETSAAISDYYEKRGTRRVVTPLSNITQALEREINSNPFSEYALWGVNSISEYVFRYMSEEYPGIKLTYVYDNFKKTRFCGLETEPADFIDKSSEAFVIACPMTEPTAGHMRAQLAKYKGKSYVVPPRVI